MARFFIDRPIFAWVIALIVMLMGILSIRSLAVAQYPSIAPPQISIMASYPGASAQTLQDTVTQVIEQQLKGLDGMEYMSSTSDSNGSMEIKLTFTSTTDPDTAQVQVQNKLAVANPMLPQEVQRQGVQVVKSTANFLMVVGLKSNDGAMNGNQLGDYAVSELQEPLSRVKGVGEVEVFGSQYAMRIWLDPEKLHAYALMPADIVRAIEEQNSQVSVGQIGAVPAIQGQQLTATINSQTLLNKPEQFEDIILRSDTDGREVRLKDVANIEVGAENYNVVSRYDGAPTAGMAFKLATGANALDTADAVKAKIDLLKARDQLLAKAAQDTRVVAVRPNGQENTPQYDLQIDHAKAMALGVSVSDINSTLAGAWGGQYVNGVKGHPY